MKKSSRTDYTSWVVFIIIFMIFSYFSPTDATDKSRWTRSGMSMYIDHGTGCQYLTEGSFFGAPKLIPRVDKDGKHVCEEK